MHATLQDDKVDVEMAIPRNKFAGLDLEPGEDIGFFVDCRKVHNKIAQATTFDQNSYRYVTLVDGSTVDIDKDDNELAHEFRLKQNYPNPFNPTTSIQYSLPQTGKVTLTVYDMLGREVATLVNGKQSAGKHEVEFNEADLASGVYLYRLQAGDKTKVRKMMLLK